MNSFTMAQLYRLIIEVWVPAVEETFRLSTTYTVCWSPIQKRCVIFSLIQ